VAGKRYGLRMFDDAGATQSAVVLTLYTDSFVIKGSLETRQRRVTDMLNLAEDPFIVLADVTFDEFGMTGRTVRVDFAQINLGSILFAVADTPAEPSPELRTHKIEQRALVATPPFKVTGHIHLLAERSLRIALTELTGQFLPVTEATYWSDTLGEPRTTAALVAINRSLAQIVAPHQEIDPWAGLDRVGTAAEGTGTEFADSSGPTSSSVWPEDAPGSAPGTSSVWPEEERPTDG
jgi:hypothetical protein